MSFYNKITNEWFRKLPGCEKLSDAEVENCVTILKINGFLDEPSLCGLSLEEWKDMTLPLQPGEHLLDSGYLFGKTREFLEDPEKSTRKQQEKEKSWGCWTSHLWHRTLELSLLDPPPSNES